jgi:Asp-tRNA(Asn)/Glu-tRNA(Gln) amidotransferase A subunit family amidase
MAVAIIGVLSAEITYSDRGLGFRLIRNADQFQISAVYAIAILIFATAASIKFALSKVEQHCARHERGRRKNEALTVGLSPPPKRAAESKWTGSSLRMKSRLRRAGLIILGKCATTEFATPIPAGVRNPRDLGRSPGVSSSGSAASVADCMTPLALGSQTGGSTILPASFCGVFGFKASLTGLDRGGIRHLRPTVDSIGLFARAIDDIALLNAVLTGRDSPAPPDDVAALRVGVCRTVNWSQAQPETVDALESAASSLRAAGATVADAELPPLFDDIERSFQIIVTVEGARTMANDVREHGAAMNHWLQDMWRTAPTIDTARYDRAHRHAVECQRALAEIFDGCDIIITPSACGEATRDLTGVSNSAFNRLWTLMHGPCINIPASTGPHDMPVGIQVVGPVGSDARTIAWSQSIAKILA